MNPVSLSFVLVLAGWIGFSDPSAPTVEQPASSPVNQMLENPIDPAIANFDLSPCNLLGTCLNA